LSTRKGQLIASGRFPRIASRFGEEWLDEVDLADPLEAIDAIRETHFDADVFTFSQHVPDIEPRYRFPMDWDNAALIRITTYDNWWNALPQIARRNVRTAAKKGISVRVVPYDDELVRGIVNLYNECPVRLGKPFWHYGKSFEAVKKENSTFLDKSTFLGAYFEEELVGFIKMVRVDRTASIMQILARVSHQDKRTTNALIAKSVEVSTGLGMSHLKYCKFIYGANDSSLLTDFKRRNGFEQVSYPRYFVPLTVRGRLAVMAGLHRGLKGMLPAPVLKFGLRVRERYYSLSKERSPIDTE
jgi:hypothetical protein